MTLVQWLKKKEGARTITFQRKFFSPTGGTIHQSRFLSLESYTAGGQKSFSSYVNLGGQLK